MKGLTLVEVLVAMGIATVVGILLLVIIVNSAGLFSNQSAKVQTGLNTNDALVSFRGSVKQASSVAEQSDTTRLVLKVASIDANGNIIDNTFDDFVFFLDQNTLHFQVFPNAASSRSQADQIFSTSIDNLKFQYLNAASLEVAPTFASRVRMSITLKQETATSEANLRND